MDDKRRINTEKRRFGVPYGITVIAILIGTLWPFNFFPSNRVTWLSDAKGIIFRSAGVVVSKAPLKAKSAEVEQSCSLELLVWPAGFQSGRTILGFYTPSNPGKFLLQQSGKDLLVSSEVADAQKKLETMQFAVDSVFEPRQPVLLTITSGPNGTLFYKNGRPSESFSRFKIPPSLSAQAFGAMTILKTARISGWLKNNLAFTARKIPAAFAVVLSSEFPDASCNPLLVENGCQGTLRKIPITQEIARQIVRTFGVFAVFSPVFMQSSKPEGNLKRLAEVACGDNQSCLP